MPIIKTLLNVYFLFNAEMLPKIRLGLIEVKMQPDKLFKDKIPNVSLVGNFP